MIGDIFASARSSHDYALLCDGSAIPTTDEYAALKALIGNYTPDLRDNFLRGNRNGRDLLSYEADGNKTHSHSGSSVSSFAGSTQSTSHSHPGSSVGSFSGNNQIASHSHSITGGDHSHPIPYSIVNGSNLFCGEERGNSQSGTINNMSSASHSHSITGGDHSHVMSHGHTLSIASVDHSHVVTHGHTLSIAGEGNAETTVKNISVNFFIVYREESTSMDMTKIDALYDFVQLLKSNFFNNDCSKAIKYKSLSNVDLYATDNIQYIDNFLREVNDFE